MSLESIQQVTELEKRMLEEKSAAEAEARALVAEAEKNGLALLTKTRSDAAASGRSLMVSAEERAAKRTAEIQRTAEAEADALRALAEQHMEEAVELIIGRVVSH